MEKTLLHYRLEGRLGEGGMGQVYLAFDEKLERQVALKVLPPELADRPERVALLDKEAKAVAAINHPGVVTIHSIEHVGQTHFITMERVQGKTLTEVIPRRGFPADEMLRLARPMVEAVGAAHAVGITHHDLKPANVMITEKGGVKVLDFGLAKFRPPIAKELSLSEVKTSTLDGAIRGTAPYMSPEQALAKPVDPTSDVFSLGTILYEMATGELPFHGDTPMSLLTSIIKDPAPPLEKARPDLSPSWHALIARCLEKDKELRYASASELLEDLDGLASGEISAPRPEVRRKPARYLWVAAAALVMLLAATTLPRWWARVTSVGDAVVSPATVIDSLAVLPFENLSGDPEQQYFSDGLTDALISELGRIGAAPRVTARASVMQFLRAPQPFPEIARRLNVNGIVESSVLVDGDSVRISAKLYHGPSETLLWSGSYEKQMQDILSLQREVASEVARQVRFQVSSRSPEPSAPSEQEQLPVEPDAYREYLRGRAQLARRRPDALQQALEHFEAAARREPDNALIYSGIAEAYVLLGSFGYAVMSPVETVPLAQQAALRAIRLDGGNSSAHGALAMSRLQERNWSGAEESFRRALELNPSNALARFQFAGLLSILARHREAIEQAQEASRLDPASLIVQLGLGSTYFFAADYEAATRAAQDTVELEPNFWASYILLGQASSRLGRAEEATGYFERATELANRNPFVLSALGVHLSRSGEPDRARALLTELEGQGGAAYIAPTAMAKIHFGLGQKDQGYRLLVQAAEQRDATVVFLSVDPDFAELHGEAAFSELARELDLLDVLQRVRNDAPG